LRPFLVGRIAVSQGRQGDRLGATLLADAERCAHESADTVGSTMQAVAGSGNDLAGPPEPLSGCCPNAKAKRTPGCGHVDCLTQPMFKAAVMDFLAGVVD
jgi:hypothetical protein